MTAKVGERVIAFEEGKKYFGFGTRVEDCVPGPEAVGFFAEAARELGRENPCIELDDGTRVWGAECWWGPAKPFEGRTDLVLVSLAESRARARK